MLLLFLPSFRLLSISICGILLYAISSQFALSQNSYNPNMGHFYMGRQQWTIEDDSPIINNRTGTAPGAMNGALPNRAPLPKAGWQGYAPIDNPRSVNSTPKASSSSKTKSAASKAGQKGKAGNLSPSGVTSYKPYATYSNPANTPSPGADPSTSTRVKGSLLHWARRGAKQQ